MRPSFEVADVLRDYLPTYREKYKLSGGQYKAVQAIMDCRTSVLGGHVEVCTECGHVEISYNSCRNRHCPKCQWASQQKWMERRMAELLPVTYYHLVFTLPEGLNPVVKSNEVKLYNLLFRTAWQTLDQLARQDKWLGAQPGMIAVLHTWGQTLSFHPHLHCIVPGGGLAEDGETWVSAGEGYLLPVKVLSKVFRGKFLHGLRALYQNGELAFYGQAEEFQSEKAFQKLLRGLYRKEWVVYAKRPFGGPEQVIRYLGRYTHRVAISNRRILSVKDGKVTFTYKDYKQEGQKKIMTLDAVEFIRRFLQHILPSGFHKIRYYGILSTRNRKTKLAGLQRSLNYAPVSREVIAIDRPKEEAEAAAEPKACPVCNTPALQYYGRVAAGAPGAAPFILDIGRAPPVRVIARIQP